MSGIRWDTVPDTHPAVVKAMRIYDTVFNETERRSVFQNTVRALVAARDTGDNKHLAEFAESLILTIRLRLMPGYQQAVRESQDRPPARYEDCIDVADLLKSILPNREEGDER